MPGIRTKGRGRDFDMCLFRSQPLCQLRGRTRYTATDFAFPDNGRPPANIMEHGKIAGIPSYIACELG